MRVILMHNPSAGTEDHSTAELTERIEDAGHKVVRDVSRRKELAAALKEKPCDLVVVAGGDGTVRNAAERLAATGIPMAILPLGTANNIARFLGFNAPTEELIAAWESSGLRGFDRGLVRQAGEATPFIEAFGLGLFPEVMHRGANDPIPDDREAVLERDLGIFHDLTREMEPRAYTIFADGEGLDGDYLLVEVMNTPLLGANVLLAPEADPADGQLDLVLVTADERKALAEHLARLRAGKPSKPKFPTRKVKQVVITSSDRWFHTDGDVLPDDTPQKRNHFDVIAEPHALQVLVPNPKAHKAAG